MFQAIGLYTTPQMREVKLGIISFIGGGGSLTDALFRIGGSPNYTVVVEGEFSIIDWTGYPEGIVPKPTGPFRILTGKEYEMARYEANLANAALHRSDPSLRGLLIHEIHPVKFGGSPVDISNKIALPSLVHPRYTTWWTNFLRSITR